MSQGPRCFVFFVRVWSVQVKKELVTGSFAKEVSTILESFNFIKFHLHEIMDGFNVGLHAMSAREDGAMELAV